MKSHSLVFPRLFPYQIRELLLWLGSLSAFALMKVLLSALQLTQALTGPSIIPLPLT